MSTLSLLNTTLKKTVFVLGILILLVTAYVLVNFKNISNLNNELDSYAKNKEQINMHFNAIKFYYDEEKKCDNPDILQIGNNEESPEKRARLKIDAMNRRITCLELLHKKYNLYDATYNYSNEHAKMFDFLYGINNLGDKKALAVLLDIRKAKKEDKKASPAIINIDYFLNLNKAAVNNFSLSFTKLVNEEKSYYSQIVNLDKTCKNFVLFSPCNFLIKDDLKIKTETSAKAISEKLIIETKMRHYFEINNTLKRDVDSVIINK